MEFTRIMREITHRALLEKDYQDMPSEWKNVIHHWRNNLADMIAEAFHPDKEYRKSTIGYWEENLDQLLAAGAPSELLIEQVCSFREEAAESLRDMAKQNGWEDEIYEQWDRQFHKTTDDIINWTSEKASTMMRRRLLAAEAKVKMLSIPIIRVSDEIAVISLVGDLDTKRTNDLMEKALQYGASRSLNCMVIDLSGVEFIDTRIAHELLRTVKAIKITGMSVKLTGIRPEIAQTFVKLGVNLNDIQVFSSLHQVL
ncbi:MULTISPECIES: STAS domain-containing protein [Bacillus]|uniref:STAS domain-containing protein n=1 Tax=Bacillus TaxID=1386 RepID=UPI0015DE52D5|nr:STAS domain-containing protein [Bacillus sp. UMB0728]